MNETTRLQLESLGKQLDRHCFFIDSDNGQQSQGLLVVLEMVLSTESSMILNNREISLLCRDILDILSKANALLLLKGQDSIDLDFFSTSIHLPFSFRMSYITKSLLDCHHRFQTRGISSEILVLYAWLLGEAWYYVLCQDTLDLWAIVIGLIYEQIQYVDSTLFTPLLECIPPELR